MKIQMPPVGLSGRFRAVVSKDTECKEISHDTGFFDNLITNVGLNRIGSINASTSTQQAFRALCGRFVVGSGSSTPQFTDTSLQSPIAIGGDVLLDNESSSYSRGWWEGTFRFQFGQGVAQGNISEIGIQHTSTSGPLWSRALVLDGAGNPTTITVREDDFLTCYYTLRIMIPQEDTIYNIDVVKDGVNIPTVVTIRPVQADTSGSTGWGLQTFASSGGPSRLEFFTGGLVEPTALTTSGSLGSTNGGTVKNEYINDSFTLSAYRVNNLNEFNSPAIATAIVSFLMGVWQVNFNPPLQKDNTQTMTSTFGYSWARA